MDWTRDWRCHATTSRCCQEIAAIVGFVESYCEAGSRRAVAAAAAVAAVEALPDVSSTNPPTIHSNAVAAAVESPAKTR